MSIYNVMLFSISVMLFFIRVRSSCMLSDGILETLPNGENRTVCQYQNIRVMEGVAFMDTDSCMHCQCDRSKLLCCGYGKAAGVYQVQGCHSIENGCDVMFVRDDNETLECLTGEPVPEMYRNTNFY